MNNRGLVFQKQLHVSWVWRNDYITQYSRRRNYLSKPQIDPHACTSGTRVIIYSLLWLQTIYPRRNLYDEFMPIGIWWKLGAIVSPIKYFTRKCLLMIIIRWMIWLYVWRLRSQLWQISRNCITVISYELHGLSNTTDNSTVCSIVCSD